MPVFATTDDGDDPANLTKLLARFGESIPFDVLPKRRHRTK
jgi:hypothetical protein